MIVIERYKRFERLKLLNKTPRKTFTTRKLINRYSRRKTIIRRIQESTTIVDKKIKWIKFLALKYYNSLSYTIRGGLWHICIHH